MPRNKINVLLHFVWSTYDRLPLITEDIERQVYRYIEHVCRNNRCDVLAVGGMPDHIHLLVNMSSTVSFAHLVKEVKGGSSRLISATLKPGEWFAWRGYYAVFSVATRDKQRIVCYIENQKQHHAEGTLWTLAEKTEDDSRPDADA
jgi:REP element-mobilizing transposase RayT